MKNFLLIIFVLCMMPIKMAFAMEGEIYTQSLYLGYSDEEIAEKYKAEKQQETVVQNITNNTYNYGVQPLYPVATNYQYYPPYPYNLKYPTGNFLVIRGYNNRPHFPASLNKPQVPPPVANKPTAPRMNNLSGFAYNYGHKSSS